MARRMIPVGLTIAAVLAAVAAVPVAESDGVVSANGANPVTVNWITWTDPGSYPESISAGTGSGKAYATTAAGTLVIPKADGTTTSVYVRLTGEIVQPSGSPVSYSNFNSAATVAYPWTSSDIAPAITGSANVPTLPPNNIIGTIGSGRSIQTLEFFADAQLTTTTSVSNVVLSVFSLGNNSTPGRWVFENPVVVLSDNGGGKLAKDQVSGKDRITGNEGHGSLQISGQFHTLSWEIAAPEDWAGWNIGATSAPVPEAGLSASRTAVTGPVGTAITPVEFTATVSSSSAASFSLVGTLPAGLSFSTTNGAITGTPTAPTTSAQVQVVLTDAFWGTATQTVTFALTPVSVPEPIAFYPFDESPGAVTTEDSVRGAPGEATLVGFGAGGGDFRTGVVGNALCFDGVNDKHAVAQLPVPQSGGFTEFTASAWVNVNALSQWGTIVKNWGEGAVGSLHLGIDDSLDLWSNFVGLSDGSAVAVKTAANTLDVGNWVHLVTTVSESQQTAVLYLNGVETQRVTFPVGGAIAQFGTKMSFGIKLNDAQTAPAGVNTGRLNGCLDEIAFWDVALASEEVGSLSYAARTGTGLAGQVSAPTPTPTTQPTVVPSPVTTVPPTTTTTPPTSTVPAPVPVGGVLPTLTPGVSQVLIDGVAESVEVFVEASTDLVMKGQDFELRLAGECTAGCQIATTADGRQVLELEERGLAKVSGAGFLPGTPVYVWLFSEPRFLGELTVNADGSFTGSVPLGDIAPGEHTLQVNGTSFDGLDRTANLGVVVNPVAAPVLPSTGSDPVNVWVLALALFGLGLILTVRRRQFPGRV